MRLARGGGAEQSAKTSLRSGMSPSTLPVFASGSKAQAKHQAQAKGGSAAWFFRALTARDK